jgi:hypothetical protein
MIRARFAGAALALALAAGGCAKKGEVVRVVDGRPRGGEFVAADAYAAYLRAAVADAAGSLPAAIEGYMVASALGPRDPEPLAKLGDARCRRDPRDPRADDAIARALEIDPQYAPAWEARAHCAERRGDVPRALDSARKAAKLDAAAVGPLETLARLEPIDGAGKGAAEELRARILALTLVEGTNVAAWDALAMWARRHRDAALEARALAEGAARDPARRAEVEAAVMRLAGSGELEAARSLARASVENPMGPARTVDARVVRLAIDDALVAGNADEARTLARRSGVSEAIVAARALLLGDAAAARAIAAPLAEADPHALTPRLVLAAAGDRLTGLRALGAGVSKAEAVPAEAWLVYARSVARSAPADVARALLDGFARERLVSGDQLSVSVAASLAARGALDPSELDADAAIELAERRAEPATEEATRHADARHRLLALARAAPGDPATQDLARALAPARGRDAIVAVAFARLALAGDGDPLSARSSLERFDPSDPLIAGAALDCALRAGDARAIPLAKARLAAVARTPAERARSVE